MSLLFFVNFPMCWYDYLKGVDYAKCTIELRSLR